jgi:hypothetical protein
MIENDFNQEVTVLVSQFRHLALSGTEDPEILKGAWKTYLSIKEKNIRPEPTSPKELNNIRKAVEIADSGGLAEHNYATFAAYYSLRVDLAMFGTRGLIGSLKEQEKEMVAVFARKMAGVLLQKTTPA